jgi:N-acylneuraminate cytidylyltransferase/CMP-N,N'-diacetyllegionaminic acid synthase
MRVLAVIPARGGSKRIPNKNIREFCGKPLIAHAIKQAKALSFVGRVVVDTDSEKIAEVAKKYGAEVPFLRPAALATDFASINEALLHLLNRLKKEEGYQPDYVVLLQTTSPLREARDIEACWELMRKMRADTVLTVAPTHPRLYHLDKGQSLVLANKTAYASTNVQEWPKAYLLNGCFVYIFNVARFLKQRKVIMKNTKAVICDKWRSIDLDTPEDWVVAERLYTAREEIAKQIASFG